MSEQILAGVASKFRRNGDHWRVRLTSEHFTETTIEHVLLMIGVGAEDGVEELASKIFCGESATVFVELLLEVSLLGRELLLPRAIRALCA
jgi:hypothetical protein